MLTCAKLFVVEDGTFADDASHGVGVGNVAHQQFVGVECMSRQVHRLSRSQKPAPMKPWITTGDNTETRHLSDLT